MKAEFIKRGNYYGSKDNGQILIRWGSPLPYPESDTVLRHNVSEIPQLIAILTALRDAK